MRKRRTREHVIADLGIHHVEGFVLRCGWTVERTRHDYGIDLLMRTDDTTGEVENGEIALQVKASDSLRRSSDQRSVRLRLEWRDLLFWLNEAMPVILVAYDAVEEQGYWLHVQRYLRDREWAARMGASATVTVLIPTQNVLDEPAVRLFARFRDEHGAS